MSSFGQQSHRIIPYYASTHACLDHDETIPEEGYPAVHCLNLIEDQHQLDFKERLNTSSYVNVVFEKEEQEVALLGLGINLADQTVYPQSFDVHNRCVNMVAELWNCPKPADFDEYGCFPGAGTVGSTEACLLAGLALKFRWRKWYAEKHGCSASEVRAVAPNLVISSLYQAAWEKLFKYMDIEPHFVMPSVAAPEGKGWAIDPSHVAEAIDEKTIGVVCIMGNHYSGHYDPVAEVASVVTAVNRQKGYQVGIHVDAASGGFVAPFQKNIPKWDFSLDEVLSISASGHKFGQSCCGTGWVVWRERKGLSDHVAISVSYLGGKADSYTLNFSRPATGVYVQFYKFLRLGMAGYRQVVSNMMTIAKKIRDGLKEMKSADGKPVFVMLDKGDDGCLPVVTAKLNPDCAFPFDSIDLQHALSMEHWYVSGYALSLHHPITEETVQLFYDCPTDQTIFRVVVKTNLTASLASHLLRSFKGAFDFLITHGKGFKQAHKREAERGGHKAC